MSIRVRTRSRGTSQALTVAASILLWLIGVGAVVAIVPAVLSYFLRELAVQIPVVPSLDWWGAFCLLMVLVIIGAALGLSRTGSSS